MRSKTVLIAVAVFVAFTVAAMAQDGVFSVSTTPQPGRAGGGAERVGDVVLTLTSGTTVTGSVTLTFSTDLTAIDETGDAATDAPWIDVSGAAAGAGTVEISGNVLTVPIEPGVTTGEIRVSGARVDLRGVTGQVNVTVSASGGNTITAGQTVATVISSIQDPFEITSSESASILATGGAVTSTVTIREGFTSAWTSQDQEDPTGLVAEVTNGYELRLRVSGVPEDAEILVSQTGGTVTGTVNITPSSTVTGDGDDLEWIIDFDNPSAAVRETLELSFFLDSADAAIPLAAGDVRLFVTSWPDGEDDEIPFFATEEIPAEGVLLFNVSAAQTTILAPLVQVIGDVDTGIAVSNTTGFGEISELSGAITFHFFPHDGASFTYTTDADSPGEGLDASGEVEAGGSYIVLASELLDAANFAGDTFRGHMFVVTDFTHAHATFFNGDFATFFHSDTGLIVGNEPESRAIATPESLGH